MLVGTNFAISLLPKSFVAPRAKLAELVSEWLDCCGQPLLKPQGSLNVECHVID
jgi:hypothetical protein